MSQRQQQQVADMAARLIAESGYIDWQLAKKKAAARLGLNAKAPLPKNSDIEAALQQYQSTFGGNQLAQHQSKLRHTALEAMTFFSAYSPRLTGAMVEMAATLHSRIEIHVFSDWSDAICVLLEDNQIPYALQDKRYTTQQGDEAWLPAIAFSADGVETLVTVFPENQKNQAPRSPITGRAMQRWTKAQLLSSTEP